MSQLKVNSIVPTGGLPSGANGGIIQVVQTFKNDTTSAANNSQSSFVDMSGMAVTITPSSNANKVLIYFTCNLSAQSSNRNNAIRLLRGSTVVGAGTGGSTVNCCVFVRTKDDDYLENKSYMFLDAPATTSATTYKLQWCSEGSGGSAKVWYLNRRAVGNYNNTPSQITAMEIST